MSDRSSVEDITVLKVWPGSPSANKVPTTIAYRAENPGRAFESEHVWGFGTTKKDKKGQRPQTCSWTKLLLDANADHRENDDPKLKEINGKGMYHLPTHRIDAGISRSTVAAEVCEDFLRNVYIYLEKHLKGKLRESVFNSTPIECWVTVPATWSDEARDITRKAAERAGFRRKGRPHDVVNVISEPEAAALSILRTDLSGIRKFKVR
jgi:molecular chaperone DnaK (HSP70)